MTPDEDCPACRGRGSVPDGPEDGRTCDCVEYDDEAELAGANWLDDPA